MGRSPLGVFSYLVVLQPKSSSPHRRRRCSPQGKSRRAQPCGKNQRAARPRAFCRWRSAGKPSRGQGLEPDTAAEPNRPAVFASRPKSRALWSANRTADRLRLADAPLGPTRAKKGRGRAASPTVGGSRGATFVALCPYVSSVVGADVGVARLWRLPADLFSGRPMAVKDIALAAPSAWPVAAVALSDTVLRCSARASSTRAASTSTANRTGLPCSAWTGERWAAREARRGTAAG